MTTPTLPNRIQGAWVLVSATVHQSDGAVFDALGPSPVGFLIYSADGHMSAHLQQADRPRFGSDDPSQASVEERAAAAAATTAYCGTYDVDEATQTLTHHVAVSLFPNWIGTAQRRKARFEGGRLILSSESLHRGRMVTAELEWERPRAAP